MKRQLLVTLTDGSQVIVPNVGDFWTWQDIHKLWWLPFGEHLHCHSITYVASVECVEGEESRYG